MHSATIAARRSIAQLPLLLAVLGLTALVTLLLAGLPRYLGLAAVTNVRESLQTASPTDAALQAQIRVGADPEAQDAAVHEVLDPLLSGTSAPVHRTVMAAPVDAALPDGSTTSVILGSDPELDERATITGDWPSTNPLGVALQEVAAENLGLSIGDALVITVDDEPTALEVVATWVARDPGDPYWFGDASVSTGESAGAVGPGLLTEDALLGLGVTPFARWTVIPDTSRLTTAELAPLAEAATTMEQALRDSPELSASGVIFAGGLGETVGVLENSVESVRGVSPVPLVLGGVIGLIALLQLARLLASIRADETTLLGARGRSRGQAASAAAIEAVAVVIPGAVIGAGIAFLAVPTLAVPLVDTLVAGGAVALVAIAVLVAVAWESARPRAVGSGGSDRAARGASVGVLVLAVVAAGVSLWQFRLYGSPLVTTASGQRLVDPIAVLAPSLVILALSLVGLAAFAPLSAVAARSAATSSGLARVLPARQVSRRVRTFAVPLLLVCLSVGGTTLATAYSGTWSALNGRAGELRNGSDVRVGLATSGTAGGAATIVSSPKYGSEAAPVLVVATEAGDDTVSLVGVSGDSVPLVLASLDGTVDRDRLASLISAKPAGIELPVDATSLGLTTETATTPVIAGAPLTAEQGDTSTVAWVADAQGALARLVLEPGDDAGSISAALPDGVAPWTVVAIDVTFTTGPNAADYGFTVQTVAGVEPADPWFVQSGAMPDLDGTAEARDDALGVTATVLASGPTAAARLMAAPSADPLPVVVTEAFATRVGLAVGDPVSLRFAGSGLTLKGTVAGTTALLPGATGALAALADLRGMNAQFLTTTSSVPRADQVWIASEDPTATADGLAAVLPDGARVTTAGSGSGDALLRPVVTALWLGAAGALALALAALGAVTGALARTRHPEVVVLRALGLSDGEQARARQRELAAVVAFAIVAGIAGGILVSALTVGDLARSAVLDAPATLPATLAFDWPVGLALLGAFVVAVAGLLGHYGVRVRRQSSTSTGREVGR